MFIKPDCMETVRQGNYYSTTDLIVILGLKAFFFFF